MSALDLASGSRHSIPCMASAELDGWASSGGCESRRSADERAGMVRAFPPRLTVTSTSGTMNKLLRGLAAGSERKKWAVAASAPSSSSFCCGGCSATSACSSSASRTGRRLGKTPPESSERYAAAGVDFHALALESQALRQTCARGDALEAETSLRINDAVPWERRSVA